jgi:hypothetical protein
MKHCPLFMFLYFKLNGQGYYESEECYEETILRACRHGFPCSYKFKLTQYILSYIRLISIENNIHCIY